MNKIVNKINNLRILIFLIGFVIFMLFGFLKFENISRCGLLIMLLPVIFLEFMIPSGLSKKGDYPCTIKKGGILLLFFTVFPLINSMFIQLVSIEFKSIPDWQSDNYYLLGFVLVWGLLILMVLAGNVYKKFCKIKN